MQATCPLKVLVVDEEPTNLVDYEYILRKKQHALTRAEGAEEARSFLRTQVFDVMLMEMHRPSPAQLGLVQDIRMKPGPNREVRILAITPASGAVRQPLYLGLGFDACLTKPVEGRALLEAVARRLTLEDRMRRRDVLREWVHHEVEAGIRRIEWPASARATLNKRD